MGGLGLEALRLLGIRDIHVLHEGWRYRFEELHLSSFHGALKWNNWKPDWAQTWAIRQLRAAAAAMQPHESSCKGRRCGRLYLRREMNANVSVSARPLGNEHAVYSLLRRNDFTSAEFGSMTLVQKAAVLRDVGVLVTPTGANTLNMLFAESPPCALIALEVGSKDVPYPVSMHISDVASAFWPDRKHEIVLDCAIGPLPLRKGMLPCSTATQLLPGNTSSTAIIQTAGTTNDSAVPRIDLAELQSALDYAMRKCPQHS